MMLHKPTGSALLLSLALLANIATLLLVAEPAQAQCTIDEIGTLSGVSDARRTATAGGLLYVGDGNAGLRIYLAEPAANPALLGAIAVPAFEVAVDGTRVYVTDGRFGGSTVSIIDVSVPGNPALLGSIDIGQSNLGNIATRGNIIAVGHAPTAQSLHWYSLVPIR